MTNVKGLMLAAVACAIAAGNAAAQTYHAEIPFAFRAGKTAMAPGAYDISFSGVTSGKFMTVRNTETRESVLLLPTSFTGDRKTVSVPKLRFACASYCALESLWVGGWGGAYKLFPPRLGPNETARVMTIELTHVKAD